MSHPHQQASDNALAPSVAHLFAAAAQGQAFPPPQQQQQPQHQFMQQPSPPPHHPQQFAQGPPPPDAFGYGGPYQQGPPPPSAYLHGPPPQQQPPMPQQLEQHPDLHHFAQQHHAQHQQQQQFHSPPLQQFHSSPPPQHFHSAPLPPAHGFAGLPPPHHSPPHAMIDFGHHEQALHQHHQQQQMQQQQPYHAPHAPPPTRQSSSQDPLHAHQQLLQQHHQPQPQQSSSGVGSLLGQTDEAEAVAPVVGVVLSAPRGVLSVSPAHKSLGGEEHASTPCSEFSQLARDLAGEQDAGCLIAHQRGVTVFALKGGIVRLVYQPAGAEDKQSEVLKAHTERVLDIAFLPLGENKEQQLLVTVSAKQAFLWRLNVGAESSKLTFAIAARINTSSGPFRRVRVQSEADAHQSLALLHESGQVALKSVSELIGAASGVLETTSTSLPHVTEVTDAVWRHDSTNGWQLAIATRKGAIAFVPREGAADAHPAIISNGESTAIHRLLLLSAGSSRFFLVARNSFRLLQLLSAQTGALVGELSLVGPAHDDVLYTALELAPSGRFAVLTYRLQEPTGEASDQGFIVIQIGSAAFDATPAFEFASAFWQPAPIASCSVVDAPEEEEKSEDGSSFDLYAVEQKPIVRLHVSRSAVFRHVPRVVSAAAASSAVAPGEGELLEPDHDDAAVADERHDAVPALRSSLPKLLVAAHEAAAAAASSAAASGDTPPSPSSSSSLNIVGPAASTGSSASNSRMQSPGLRMERPDFSPVDQPAHLLEDYNSGRNSPAVSGMSLGGGSAAAAAIANGGALSTSSIVSIGSPSAKPTPVLRPRGNSVESRVSFNVPSSQPTPAGTPAPGTPLLRGGPGSSSITGSSSSHSSLPSSEGTSPMVSPLPSPRGSASISSGARTGTVSPGLSPLQATRAHSVASTTAEGSAAQSPLSSSPSSPPDASTPPGHGHAAAGAPGGPHHTLDESNIGALGAPGTPTTLSRGSSSTPSLPAGPPPSSTVTPAATPLSRGTAGGVGLGGGAASSSAIALANMSTADVSLHFLSATSVGQDPTRVGGSAAGASGAGGAGANGAGGLTGPTSTPLNTPAPSVPSTPRLAGALPPRRSSGMSGMLLGSGAGGAGSLSGVGTAASNASLRVRTTSGSTSPSPIGSPSIVGVAYQKGRSASMDRAADTFGARLLSAAVMEEEVNAADAEVRQHNQKQQQTAPEDSAASKAASAKRSQEATLIQRLDQLFSRHFGRLSGVLAQERLELQQAERQRFESLSASIVSAVTEGVETSVQASLREVLPLLVAELGHAAPASAGGAAGASGVNPAQISDAVLAGLNQSLRDAFRTAFTSSLLPSFETAIKAMLAQVANSVASLNTTNTAAGNKVAAEALALAQRSAVEAKQRAQQLAESAKREQAAQAQLAEMSTLIKAMAASQATLNESVADMKQQLRVLAARPAALSVAAPSAPSSPAQTAAVPPPTPSTADAAAEVSALLAAQQFEQAFTRALSSGKLPVVLAACRQLDARTLFATTIPAHKLSSPVVLSLCQQLATSLPSGSTATDADLLLKLVWLRECAMAIIPNDALIGAHVRPVLGEVLARLNSLPRALVDPVAAPQNFDLVRMIAQVAQLKSA